MVAKTGSNPSFPTLSDSAYSVAAQNQGSREMAIAQPLSKRQADQIGYQLPQPRQTWRADKLANSA